MVAGLREILDKADEVGGMLEGIVSLVVVFEDAGWVAAECKNVADTLLGVAGQDRLDVGLLVANAGEVWNGIERS